LHVLAPGLFLVTGVMLEMGVFYYGGLAIAVSLLWYQHRLISPRDLSRAGVAFFNLNGLLSVVMFCFTLLDILFPMFI